MRLDLPSMLMIWARRLGRHYLAVLLGASLLTAGSVVAIGKLRFNSDLADLLPAHHPDLLALRRIQARYSTDTAFMILFSRNYVFVSDASGGVHMHDGNRWHAQPAGAVLQRALGLVLERGLRRRRGRGAAPLRRQALAASWPARPGRRCAAWAAARSRGSSRSATAAPCCGSSRGAGGRCPRRRESACARCPAAAGTSTRWARAGPSCAGRPRRRPSRPSRRACGLGSTPCSPSRAARRSRWARAAPSCSAGRAAGRPWPAPAPGRSAPSGEPSRHDVHAVGDAGTVVHFDGHKLERRNIPWTDDLAALHGTSAVDVWAAGSSAR